MEKIAPKVMLLAATFLSGAWVPPGLAAEYVLLGQNQMIKSQRTTLLVEYNQGLPGGFTESNLPESLAEETQENQESRLAAAERLAGEADQALSDAARQANVAVAFSMADDPERALFYIDRAVALAPENSEYWNSKAIFETWLGRYEEGEASLEQAFILGLPETEENLIRLASLQQWQDHLDASIRTLGQVNQLNPDNVEHLLMLTRLYSWRGDYQRSLNKIDDYLAAGGDPLLHAQERSLVLAWASKPDAALAVSDPMIGDNPDDVPLLIGQAVAYQRLRDYETSFGILDQLDLLTDTSDEVVEVRRILTAPVRSNLDLSFRASTDRDNITLYGGQAVATIALKPGTYFRVGGEAWRMTAPVGSGLDRIDNFSGIVKTGAWLEFETPLSDNVWGSVRAGGAFTNFGADIFAYDVQVNARTSDNTVLKVGTGRDLFMASPRSLSLGITTTEYYAGFDHTPNLDWFVQGRIAFIDLNDSNRKIQGDLSVIRNVFRRADYNINIGINATVFGYSKDLPNGYYDPSHYQRYLVPVYFYYKFNDDDGLNITIAPGIQKDNTMSSFHFAGAASAELTIGLFRDWMFKAFIEGYYGGSGAIIAAGNYWIVGGGARLVRRF